MPQFEYKVVPAPTRGDKVKGVKQPEARFAHSVESVLNRMAEGGWEFVRAEMLPNEERSGLSKTTREWRNLLIFRRERNAPEAIDPSLIAAPAMAANTAPPLRAEPSPEFAEEPAAFVPAEPTPPPEDDTDDDKGAIALRGWRDRD
ncbi:DUF4177 domain-containing protein [Marinibacterium sp. SX1]|uniref:DUF4177 domain-containing protein n=1 Tax=Marinibacterium sp. SX1 TaxID=3388424 RepID=UPI003D17D3AC